MLKENRKAVTKKGQVIGYLYYAEEEKKVYFERGEKWILIDTCVLNTLTKMEYEKIGEEKILIKLHFNDALEMRYINIPTPNCSNGRRTLSVYGDSRL